jgi:hypothetical protein
MTPSTELFRSWAEYAKGAGIEPGAQVGLGEKLRNAGFDPYRSKKERGWSGIMLRRVARRYDEKDG